MRQNIIIMCIAIWLLPLGLQCQTTRCEANINGFKIHNIYIMGWQYHSVEWAYKHLSEETCLTPVMDLAKADAILELQPLPSGATNQPDDGPVTVSCTSTASSSSCTDSTGNVLNVNCSGDTCNSYYGPEPTRAVAQGLLTFIESRWPFATARIYTTNRKLLWRSIDTKGDWFGAQWPDLVRLGTNSPVSTVFYAAIHGNLPATAQLWMESALTSSLPTHPSM